MLTHSNHLGPHLDGEIHFFTAGKDIAQLELNDFLVGPGVVVDLSDATGDYQIYTPEMIEERVEVREGDILIIHTGYHHFGWDQPYADEIRSMVQHPGPDREFSVWAKEKKIKWIGVDCGSADHPMNTIIRDWMPRQAAEADEVFQNMYGATLAERFTPDKYQLMHIEMFPDHIIHAECIGNDIDLLVNRRATIGFLYDQSRELAVLEERTRLARDLHDSVTQSLYGLVLLTEGWRRLINAGGETQIEDHLGRIGEIAQQALREMRLLIHELRPPMLEQEGLVGAVRKRLDAVEKRVGIEARVVMEDLVELPASLEEGLYWITQEALNNALKHAAASKETVRICVEGGLLVLEIADDGQGFGLEAARHKGGMGLVSMGERARQMSGTLTIESAPGQGATVTVRVPAPSAEGA